MTTQVKERKKGQFLHYYYRGQEYDCARDMEPVEIPPAVPPGEPGGIQVVRKNQANMSENERERFKAAYVALIDSGFMSFHVDHHSNMTHRMHGTMSGPIAFQRFLPWHRVYLDRLGEALRQVDPDVFIPYWDWTDDPAIPDWLGDLTPTVILPNGNSINVTRSPGTSTPSLPTQQSIDSIMQETAFTPFTRKLEGVPFGAHNQVHVWVGGTMFFIPTAPADALFWLHHAEVDRLWAQWQDTHPNQTPSLAGADAILDPWPERFDEVLSIDQLGYRYA